jgi:hypothetical protein
MQVSLRSVESKINACTVCDGAWYDGRHWQELAGDRNIAHDFLKQLVA